jgi:general bacterial porin, GBP family
VSAFAQSSVVIDGLFDVSYAKVSGDQATYNTTSVNSTAGSATSTINIKVTEDLGNGTKARIQYELDPRKSTTGIDSAAPLALHQSFVALDNTKLGTIKLGTVNSAALDAFGAASPLGTATGSGYGYTNTTVGMATRFAKSVKYESPVFAGFSASYNYAPGNDQATTYLVAAQRKVGDLGLKYANGPLNVQYSQLTSADSTNVVTATVVPAGVKESTFKTLGANYTIGATTLYAGWNKGDAIGAAASATGLFPLQAIVANTATKGSRVGIKYVTGAYTLIASSAKQDIVGATSGAVTRKVSGLRAENALSKRTSVFVAYESFNTGVAAASATTAAEGGTIKTTAIGIRHTF